MKARVRRNALQRLLARGRPAFGPNLQIPSPELVEMIGLAGFDYVLLDGEHGAAFSRLPELLCACDAAGLTSLVRVPSHDRSVLLPPLELGAGGVQVPFVESAEQARRLVRECKFPPVGGRGMSLVSRAARYGAVSAGDYTRAVNRETLLVVQIESPAGVEHAAEIAATDGVDLVFIGPADLAQGLGHPADRLAPATARVIERLVEAVLPHKPVAISAFSEQDVARWHRRGVRCFLTSSARPLLGALQACHERLRAGLP